MNVWIEIYQEFLEITNEKSAQTAFFLFEVFFIYRWEFKLSILWFHLILILSGLSLFSYSFIHSSLFQPIVVVVISRNVEKFRKSCVIFDSGSDILARSSLMLMVISNLCVLCGRPSMSFGMLNSTDFYCWVSKSCYFEHQNLLTQTRSSKYLYTKQAQSTDEMSKS